MNTERNLRFQKVEQALKDIRAKALSNKNSLLLHAETFAVGFSVKCAEKLKLEEFARPDHAGNSLALLYSQIVSLPDIYSIELKVPGTESLRVAQGGEWDSKAKLKLAAGLLFLGLGLDLDNFK